MRYELLDVSLSDVEIAQVVAELAPRLAGLTVGKVFQPDEHTLVVELSRDRLLLATHPRASRLHLARRAPAAGSPSAFAMLLRKRLSGLRLVGLEVAPGERVVTLGFGAGRDRLVAELTGPHANLLLVGADGMLAASLRRTASTTRVLSPGHPYEPPPPAPANARWRGQKRFGEPPGVAERVAEHYERWVREAELASLRLAASVQIQREAARLARREKALLGDLEKIAAAAVLKKHADLLLTHRTTLPGRGATAVTVEDVFAGGEPWIIPLDPSRDPVENATRYYAQHKRLSAGKKLAEARLAETRALRAAALARLAGIDELGLNELRVLSPAPRRRAVHVPEERLPYREYRAVGGEAIWVGRSAADNDALTFRHARGGDLWLHCRDAAGSHVVLPMRSGKPLAQEALLDAATLAAHFSPLSDEEQVDVTYTHVKHLRKPRGAPPGRVFVSEAKTIRIRREPARLTRLLRN